MIDRDFKAFKDRLLRAISRGEFLSDDKAEKEAREKFKKEKAVAAFIGQKVTEEVKKEEPVHYKYSEEDIRLNVAVRAIQDMHKNNAEHANYILYSSQSNAELEKYLERELVRAEISVKHLKKLLNGEWVY